MQPSLEDQPVEHIYWAAIHTNQLTPKELYFPYNDSKSVSMIHHAMNVINKAVHRINPGQVHVITVDQALYRIAKQIQWSWPITHGEDHFVIVLRGLHIEMAALKILGDLPEGSGWVEALVQANIATKESFRKASHITRTSCVHQVTASSLHIPMTKAYKQYTESRLPADPLVTIDNWCTMRQQESPQSSDGAHCLVICEIPLQRESWRTQRFILAYLPILTF